MPATTRNLVDQELTARLRLAVGRLARRLRQQADPDITPSMLSALSNIEERGLVVRVPDPTDRRVHRISLSADGERFVARSKRRKNAYLAKLLQKLDADEVAKLEAAVGVIEKILEGK